MPGPDVQGIEMTSYDAKRMFYQQRAKSTYLRSSDRCTQFFHDVVKRNNKRNAIVTITKSSGE